MRKHVLIQLSIVAMQTFRKACANLSQFCNNILLIALLSRTLQIV